MTPNRPRLLRPRIEYDKAKGTLPFFHDTHDDTRINAFIHLRHRTNYTNEHVKKTTKKEKEANKL